VSWRMGAWLRARDRGPAEQGAAGGVRHQAADRAQHRRLADPGRADEQDEFSLGRLEVDAPYGGFVRAVVRHRDVLEADHGSSLRLSSGAGVTKAGSRPARTAAAGHRGNVGATSGTTPGCRAGGSRAAATNSAAATAAPEPGTSQARTSQRSGR